MHRDHVNNGRSRGNVGTRSLTPLKKEREKKIKKARAPVDSSISVSIGWIVFLSHPIYLPLSYEGRVRNSAPPEPQGVVGVGGRLLLSDIENRRKEQCARSRAFVRRTTAKRNARARRYLDTLALT